MLNDTHYHDRLHIICLFLRCRDGVRVCVCVWERKRESMCVCVSEGESGGRDLEGKSEWGRKSEKETEYMFVCESVGESGLEIGEQE